MEEGTIIIKDINKVYNEQTIFKDFNITLDKNKVNCILGKSGCGKSTLLNIISGIIKNDIEYESKLEDLSISYIFQEDRLIDWINVEENIKIVLKKYYKINEIHDICTKYLKIVGLYEYKKYYPQMLSGGLRQRVNIARALAYPSQVLLMDEPFKSIDVVNKKSIMDELKIILSKENKTVVFVTHDIEEALYLGHKIYILGDRPVKIRKVIDNDERITKTTIETYI